MSIPHISIQKNSGWCVLHTFTNVFMDSYFESFVNNPEFMECGDKEINLILEDYDFRLSDVFYINQHYGRLSMSQIFEIVRINEGCYDDELLPVIPYILTVRRTIGPIWHCTAILNIKGRLYYSDPYNEEMIEFKTPEELQVLFIDCHRVQRPYLINSDKFVFLRGELMYKNYTELTLSPH